MVLVLFYASSRANRQVVKGREVPIDLLAIPSGLLIPLGLRTITGFLSDILLFVAYNYTTFSKAQCIFFLNTIMIPICAYCIVREKIRKQDIIAIVISFAGMLLIIQPFKSSEANINEDPEITKAKFWKTFAAESVGFGLAFMAAVAGALSVIFNKKCSDELHNSVVGFWNVMSNVLFCPLWSFIQQRETFP